LKNNQEVNVLDLDPRRIFDERHPHLSKDLKDILLEDRKKVKVGTNLNEHLERKVVHLSRLNIKLFSWSIIILLDLDLLAKPIRSLGEGKR